MTTTAAVPATQQPLVARPYALLTEVVGPNGEFLPREKFKAAAVTGGGYTVRKGVIDTIRLAGDQLNGLSLVQRVTLFRFVQQESRRYFGTARRRVETQAGPKGGILPRLEFATKREAVAYHEALQGALAALRATKPAR